MSGRVKVIETDLKFKRELKDRGLTEYLVIHHVGNINRDVDAKEVHQWHINRGFDGIGYHYVIRKNGTIERGRPWSKIGSHCVGQDSNFRSLGILVVGDFEKFFPIYNQMVSLTNLCGDLCTYNNINPLTGIKGHRDMAKTLCPGKNLYQQLEGVSKKVKYLIDIKGAVRIEQIETKKA